MSFNPASYAVAGFVDVTNMSREDRKRLAQNDDVAVYGSPEARQGTLAHAAIEANYAPRPVINGYAAHMIQELKAAASRFAQRTDEFSFGKPATCRDLAEKLERFGSFASDKQADFAYKLIGWSLPRGAAHPMDQDAPAKAPASPVAASAAPAPAVTLPKLFALMQRLSKLTIGYITIARKNQDSLCWIKLNGVEGVVGKIEGGTLTVFRSRMGAFTTSDVLAELLKIEADPEAAAALHGKLSGRCSVCSRDLTDPESIARGIGPICLEKF